MRYRVTAHLNQRREAMLHGFAPADVVTPSETGELAIEADSIAAAASATFARLNDRPGATERSLSVGDVLHIVSDEHDVWLSVEGMGFDLIDQPVVVKPAVHA